MIVQRSAVIYRVSDSRHGHQVMQVIILIPKLQVRAWLLTIRHIHFTKSRRRCTDYFIYLYITGDPVNPGILSYDV